jgi:hypothetical protein
MAKRQKSAAKQIAELKAENKRLKAQVEARKSKSSRAWRTALLVLIVSLACSLLAVANVLFWAGRTLVDNQRYTETISSVIEKPAVQQAIADKTTKAIFERVDVNQLLLDALPPRADFAVPTLTTQIQNATKDKANEVVASQQFQEVWVNANSKAHERFINLVRNYEGDGTIDLSDVYAKLVERLGDTKLAFLGNVQLPQKIGSIQILDAPRLKQAHWLVVNLDALRIVTILVFLGLSALAVYLSRNRRKLTIRLGLTYSSLMLISLVAGRISREISVGKVDPQYQEAARQAWQALLHPLVLQTTALLVIGLVVAFVAWVTGTSQNAKRIQKFVDNVFSGRVHQAVFGGKENIYTKWVGRYLANLQWVVLALAFASLLIVSISLENILRVSAVTVLAIAILQISAARE